MSAMNNDDSSFLSENSTATSTKKNPINPKIMLSIIILLFLTLVAIMCFHSYFHWISQRRRRRLLASDTSGTVPRPPASGLDISVLMSLPAFTFSLKNVPCECTVCLSEFEEGHVGRKLPNCGHSFHMACIDEWFGSNVSCPLCRAPVDWRGKDIVLTVVMDDVQARAGDSAPQLGLSRTSYSSCSYLVGKEEEGIAEEELRPEKMEERCKELGKMGFCFAERKRSDNRVLSLKRIWSV